MKGQEEAGCTEESRAVGPPRGPKPAALLSGSTVSLRVVLQESLSEQVLWMQRGVLDPGAHGPGGLW